MKFRCVAAIVTLISVVNANSIATKQTLLRASTTNKVGFSSCTAAKALLGIETTWGLCNDIYRGRQIVSCFAFWNMGHIMTTRGIRIYRKSTS